MADLLLATLLSFFPHLMYRESIERRHAQIVVAANDAEAHPGVPAGILLVVGFMESHLGAAPRSGGCWGAPINATHRLTAGTPMHAARVLARGRAHCGDWRGAIGFFRSGACDGGAHTRYVVTATRLIRRLYTSAGQSVPAGL